MHLLTYVGKQQVGRSFTTCSGVADENSQNSKSRLRLKLAEFVKPWERLKHWVI
jgi:hypothetical protein